MGHSDIDREVASAKLDSILNDEETTHSLDLPELTNVEVMALVMSLEIGGEQFHRDGMRDFAEGNAKLIDEITSQTSDLEKSLEEIYELSGNDERTSPDTSSRSLGWFRFTPTLLLISVAALQTVLVSFNIVGNSNSVAEVGLLLTGAIIIFLAGYGVSHSP